MPNIEVQKTVNILILSYTKAIISLGFQKMYFYFQIVKALLLIYFC